MKNKTVFAILSVMLILASCISTDPAQGAMEPTALQAASAPAQPAAQQPAAPAPPQVVTVSSPTIDAWLLIVLEGNNSMLRAISSAGKPMRELGAASTRPIYLAASSNPAQPWFSQYDGEDNSLTILNVTSNTASELILLLKSKELPAEKKTLLQAEFMRSDQPAQTWSPDGTRLAYLDVPTGNKTRLMVYDTASKASSALNQTTEDVTAPVWSPDGQWILYQTIDGFSAQGLPKVTSMHAVRSNGSEDRLLYTPASLRETVMGWSAPDIFVVQTTIERGNRDLRLVSLKDGSSLSLNAGLIKNAGWDEKTQTAMYLLTASETNNEQPSGVYAVTASSPQRMVLPGKWDSLQYFRPSGTWIAAMPGEIGIIQSNEITGIIKGISSVKTVSPDAKFFVADPDGSGTALYAIDGSMSAALAGKSVEKAAFSPDSQKVYFSYDFSLFMAAAPEWKPQSLPDGTTILGWVGF